MPGFVTHYVRKRLEWLETAKRLKLKLHTIVELCEALMTELGIYMDLSLEKFAQNLPSEEKLISLKALNEVHQLISVEIIHMKGDLAEDCESASIWLFGAKIQRRRAERKLKAMIEKALGIGALIGEAERHLEAVEL